jgi:hypothetical protein
MQLRGAGTNEPGTQMLWDARPCATVQLADHAELELHLRHRRATYAKSFSNRIGSSRTRMPLA